ncbi:MAG: peptidoglycan DD-metalloendopeptidase family protein [Bacteroidia bacterium]|nr:peptidoglycan DD-metalloendopeptidase family protein [Bacteroidia bacterium]
MKNAVFSIVLFTFLFNSYNPAAQTRKELEAKKKKQYESIEYTNKLLRETKSDSKNSYNKLMLLNKKISLRKELINSISKEISLINRNITENLKVIESLEKDFKKLKQDYAKMIYYAYKNYKSNDRLMFILSSDDFNQAYKRLKYFQYYSQYRKKQANLVLKTRNNLEKKVEELNCKKQDRQNLINSQQEESIILELEKTEQSKLLEDLKSKENELKKQIARQRKVAEEIENAIHKIIEEEAKKAAELAKKDAKADKFALTPEEQIISNNFEANQGKLPWPTEHGEITDFFGEHDHPIIPGIKKRNNGIDISTDKSSIVRAIFDGEVRQILDIPSVNHVIILRHGNYLSVYQNLDEVYVKKGQKVKTKQTIGKLFARSSDDIATLHIEIWKENTKLDPAIWLSQ